MSEEKPEVKDEEDIVSDNVAYLKAKIINLEALVEELKLKLDAMTGKYEQAKEFVEADAKKELLAYVSPRVTTPKELLVLKTVDELKEIKKVLDTAAIPAFKSGTPLAYEKKPSSRQKLDSMHSDYMAYLMSKKRGGS